MNLGRILAIVLLGALLLAACSSAGDGGVEENNGLSGHILLWHNWQNSEADALAEALARFTRLHPDVVLKQQQFATRQEMLDAYKVAVQSGLGPDLMLVPSQPQNWIRQLATDGMIAPINDLVAQERVTVFSPGALEMLTYGDKLYGLPQSLDGMVLFYKAHAIDSPPASLTDLQVEANSGRSVYIGTGFEDAFWGVQAFGGRLMDEERRVILDQGGFANWLSWLESARNAPGMVLDGNREILRERFLGDPDAYYVGLSSELGALIEAAGDDAIGVAALPTGPTGQSSPLLRVLAYLFSPVSSPEQSQIATELALFLTNAEQSASLMRTARQVPANSQVRVNPRLYPRMAAATAQVRSAISVRDDENMATVWRLASDVFARVLEGVVEPVVAAQEVTAAINAANGFEPLPPPVVACDRTGQIALAHGLDGEDLAELERLAQKFIDACPEVTIDFVSVEPDTLPDTVLSGGLPNVNLIHGPHTWASALAEMGALYNIAPLAGAETLQRYDPVALTAFRTGEALYGLPTMMAAPALYYNTQLVADPARTLDDLAAQLQEGLPFTIDARFTESFWGLPALGGALFDEESRSLLGEGPFADWLTWLRTATQSPAVTASADPNVLMERFLSGESAYLIADLSILSQVRLILGEDGVGVAPLPSGPVDDAGPMIFVDGLMAAADQSLEEAQLALDFAAFVTNATNQAETIRRLDRLPVNTNVDISDQPDLSSFMASVQTGQLMPSAPEADVVWAFGSQAYQAALVDGEDPTEIADALAEAIDERNGRPPSETDDAVPSTDQPDGEQSGAAAEE